MPYPNWIHISLARCRLTGEAEQTHPMEPMAHPKTPSSPLRSPCPLDVFEYLDLQRFLADYYAERKANTRAFSYRAFSRRVGLSSPNHLKRVIDGERPLTAPMAVRYADAIGLEGDAHGYFLDLAAFARSDTMDERNEAWQRLMTYRRAREAHRLDLKHAAYHATWYVPAIRELVEVSGFREDPAWIARRLTPSPPRRDVEDALDTLLDLGLLVRDADGNLTQSDAVVTTGAETRGMHIANYHRAMLKQAAESIDHVVRSERNISSLTFACSDAVLSDLKERIIAFRRELIAVITESPDDSSRVVQLNMQLFPLSTPEPQEPS